MKINEAPEKIYLDEDESWHLTNPNGDSIEYIRTDAFIKEAADYIKKDMLDNLAFQGRLNRIEIIDGIVEKFIEAMKGK